MRLVPAIAAATALTLMGRWLSRLILSTSVTAFGEHLATIPDPQEDPR